MSVWIYFSVKGVTYFGQRERFNFCIFMDYLFFILHFFSIGIWVCRWYLLSFWFIWNPLIAGTLVLWKIKTYYMGHFFMVMSNKVIYYWHGFWHLSHLLLFLVKSLPEKAKNVFHLWQHSLYWLSLGQSEVQRREWKGSFFCIYRGWRWKFSLVEKKNWWWNSINLSLEELITCQALCRNQQGQDCRQLLQGRHAAAGVQAGECISAASSVLKDRPGRGQSLLSQKFGDTFLWRRRLWTWPKSRLVSTI